jgi:PEP-CTERM motif
MKSHNILLTLVLLGATTISASALSVTQTTDSSSLSTALSGGNGLTAISVSINSGNSNQFGTFTGFNSPSFSFQNGIVISTGFAEQTTSDYHSSDGSPSSNMGYGSTPEFTDYATGRISNFHNAYDVASLKFDFSLASESSIVFKWAFGSVEYPVYTSNFTDSFFAFLDGTSAANQIVFDANNNPVQVGNSFASEVITNDTQTAFSSPHGILSLTTQSGTLSAGNHSMIFEIGDVNDHVFDSAVFISGISATNSSGGGPSTTTIPEPSTYALFGIGAIGMLLVMRRKKTA